MNELEHDLLQQAQAGDMNAYEDLQLLLEPDLRRFVRRMVNNPYVEDDILQDVFIRFYLNMNSIKPVSNLRPYIFRIARNRCYDEFRQYGHKEGDLSLDDEPVQMRVSFTEAHHVPKPDDITHWILVQLEVREAIDNLPDTQREALILYSEEQMSYAEIAEIMECSVGTVKSR
ncbi:MAG: RNA polymerase sigma factor, partial [Anaerolineae bacterium]|nr:RNA polymerase sigma factor [Anaerolineae bacterium]